MCLRPNPGERPSATTLLKHRWFKRMATKEPTKLVRSLVASAPPLLERLDAEREGCAPWQAHGGEGNFSPSHYGHLPNRTGHKVRLIHRSAFPKPCGHPQTRSSSVCTAQDSYRV